MMVLVKTHKYGSVKNSCPEESDTTMQMKNVKQTVFTVMYVWGKENPGGCFSEQILNILQAI